MRSRNTRSATWAAWRSDPQRCTRLHYVGVEGHPARREDQARAAHYARAGDSWSRTPAVSLAVAKRQGANAVVVADEILARLKTVQGALVPDDVAVTYDIGANSYVAKPILYEELLEVLQTLGRYWLEVVDLPSSNNS